MSTQNHGFPPVSLHLPDQFQNIRLVEVPDEIVDILSQGENLSFKSSPPLASDSIDKGGNLQLCSNERSWLVKQVSTSNSLYVVLSQTGTTDHRSPKGSNNEDEAMTDINAATTPSSSSNYLTAISKPTNVLELYPIPTTTQQSIIHEHLTNLVPLIDEDFENLTLRKQSRYSCKELLHHITAPDSLITKALVQRCIGDHWQGKAFRPRPSLLLETWKRIVTFAISSSLDIDDVLLGDKTSDIQFDDSEFSSIFSSIAMILGKSGGYFEENSLVTVTEGQPQQQQQRRFKPQDTARWVGNLLLLAAKDKGRKIDKDAFEAAWEDLVPAGWVRFCSVEVLFPACIVEKGESGRETVQWAPFQPSDNDQTGTQDGIGKEKEMPPKTATGKNKRKWHEKFAAQRNAKK